MTLINIEYGSLASSDTMNKNFSYLEDKIAEVSTATTTLISSIMSNIATINSRLSDLAEDIEDNSTSCQAGLNEVKTKMKLFFNKMSMVPNWEVCYELTGEEKVSYTSALNGYLLLNLSENSDCNITINEVDISIKSLIPIKAGDQIEFSQAPDTVYFLPSADLGVEE